MRQAFEEYRCELDESAECFARTEDARERDDHLRAYNLGRMVERLQNRPTKGRRPIPWLLLGLAIGMACGSLFPNDIYRAFAGRFLTQAREILTTPGKTGAR